MALVQALRAYLEDYSGTWCQKPETLTGFPDRAVVGYHVDLCVEAGYVRPVPGVDQPKLQLTWAGHNELDRLRGQS